MIAGDLTTGDRIVIKSHFGYILEALHCDHGLSKIVWTLDESEEIKTGAYLTSSVVTSGLEIVGPDVIEEEPDARR